MLMNCPRCGFSQPNDQYCAQCGVDMQSYKPKTQPVLKKILQSGMFQIFLLFTIAIFIGQYIIRGEQPQKWVQKIARFQRVTKTIRPPEADQVQATTESSLTTTTSKAGKELQDLKSQAIAIPVASKSFDQNVGNNSAVSANVSLANKNIDEKTETSALTFRLIYAEVLRENLVKWVNDSANAGLYQNLQDYSVGIMTDFRKRPDTAMSVLQTSEKKLLLGQSDSNLAGAMTDDSAGQMIGLATALEYRTNENGVLHGAIIVSRNNRQLRENFPAEFDLPRGAIFFLVGALKINSFISERARLTMPPFQILKSPDFMTQKTEFVIILEPEYK